MESSGMFFVGCCVLLLIVRSVGPVDLTRGTLIPDGGELIPTGTIFKPLPALHTNRGVFGTVTDNAYNQGSIPVNAIGVFFPPITSNPKDSGELTFGAIDGSKLDSPLTYMQVYSLRVIPVDH